MSERSAEWQDSLRRIAAGEDVGFVLDEMQTRQLERTRDLLREEGREDLVAELDARLRDGRLGLDRARSVWHSISPAQRRVLLLLSLGRNRELIPAPASRTRYGMIGDPHAIRDCCGIGTIRNLHSRSLIEPAADNVFRYRLTEHARFVLKHGQAPTPAPEERKP